MSNLEVAGYTVGRVAELSGVTIRTLHHYDEIGLLSPGGRSASGYRLYADSDLERLGQILFYRELGFDLKEISAIVDAPRTDALGHLRRQRKLLVERIERLGAMVDAIDYEMEARTMNIRLTPEERFEVFGEFRPEDHAEEAERRWGETDSYKESQRRVSKYGKEDWQRLKAEEEEIRASLAAAFGAGLAPDSEEAMAAAEESPPAHQPVVLRRSYEMHAPHRHVRKRRAVPLSLRHADAGLAAFIRNAAHANASRRDL